MLYLQVRKLIIFLGFIGGSICLDNFSTLDDIKPSASDETQTIAVQNLLKRILPDDYEKFEIGVDSAISQNGKDTFELSGLSDESIKITGSTGVAAATGLNYYLKYYCSSHISWEVSQINVPDVLPQVNVTETLNDRFRYYQNVCTTSYSFVWWDWEKWEIHLDWMALNSYNLVLAFNGQEAIWERVYERLNMTRSEIDEQFTGPAFLSWLRMGNVRGWGGPLTSNWQTRSLILEKQILKRMRELGMIPVLPAFAGFVPRAFKRLYPNSDMTEMGRWSGFDETYCCSYLLNPTEELFNTIGRLFLNEMISEFGTDHVYNCDTFNEMPPSNSDLDYLANMGAAIYKSITDVDEQGIWMLQGWMFFNEGYFWTPERAEALLTSVPLGRMIVLDLQSEQFPQYERLSQYFGQPYIWCMLHNFGGTLGMFGSMEIINEVPHLARIAENSTMIGTGLTPEGINQNYVVYDLMSEAAWRKEPADLTVWVSEYTKRRYGGEDEKITKAWQILKDTIYNFKGEERIRNNFVITVSPSRDISIWNWYNTSDLMVIWELFLESADTFETSSGYLHDLVDLTRQVLQVVAEEYYVRAMAAFAEQDAEDFLLLSNSLLHLFDDLDEILATREAFLLGRWLEDARNAAADEEEARFNEYNAKNQITLWGPNGEIMDYANKQWSGMVSDYYKQRWALYLSFMYQSLRDATSFNENEVKNAVFEFIERPFASDDTVYPAKPKGDTVEIAKVLRNKYIRLDFATTKNVSGK